MALGGKIDNHISFILINDFFYQSAIADVAFDEFVVGMVFKSGEVFKIAGIGKLVEIYDKAIGML